jgi:DNA-binding SARP family transcriptional activator/TolB-like protein/cytochrome c-type biogenesis protein CcmH/NrfG
MQAETPAEPKIEIRLFGQFEILRAGARAAIGLKSKKARALLAYLALHLDRAVPRSRIASLLWEDQPEAAGRHSLRQILSELREDIGPGLDDGISKEDVRLDSRHFDVDAVRFLRCSRNVADFPMAVALYTGDLSGDLEINNSRFDEWLLLERQKLHALALKVFDSHVRALNAADEKEKALGVCEQLFALDPLRENTHRLLLTLEAAVNGRNAALVRAEKLKQMLREQLSVSPEPETLKLISTLANSAAEAPHAGIEPPAAASETAAPSRHTNRYYAAAALVMAFVAAAGWGFWWLNGSTKPQEAAVPPPAQYPVPGVTYSIAVIPFTPRGDNDQIKRFTSALEEDVIDSLSRVPRFLIISRQTSRAYRNTAKDAREIGKELNVEFLLSGNVDTDGEKFLVRAQLTDTQSGLQVWSGRYAYEQKARYAVFEEIVLGVARQLQIQVTFTEETKRLRADKENPSYGDLIHRAWAEAFRSFSKPENADYALQLFEQAITLHPNHSGAQVGIAGILIRRVSELRSPDGGKDLDRAEMLLLGVLKERPHHATANHFLGLVYKHRGRIAESVVQFTKAIEQNPSNPNPHVHLGHALILLGRAEEATTHIQKAIRLSPQDPLISGWFMIAGEAEMQLRRYDEGIRWLERSTENYSRSPRAQMYLAAAYMLKGDRDAAAQSAKKALTEIPHLKAEDLTSPAGEFAEEYRTERERILDAMREALKLARNT